MQKIIGRLRVASIVAVVTLLVAAGCGKAHTSAPSPSKDQVHDFGSYTVFRMPDGFRNVARGCDLAHHQGIYMSSSKTANSTIPGSVYVVQNDVACGGTGR